jgi:biopolymer transport protein ExbD
MASMIDVVFLLLIFFMCTSSFRGQESDLPTQLPQVGGGAPGLQADFDPIRIRVSKVETGVRVALDGRPCVSFDDLGEQLEKRRRLADVPVLIEGDPAVPFEYMVASLDACYEADLTRVAFSAKGAKR